MSQERVINVSVPSGDFIPFSIGKCPFFTPKEAEIITHIVNMSKKYGDMDGGCTLTNQAIADDHETTAEKVSKTITKAKRLGWVQERMDTNIQVRYTDSLGNTKTGFIDERVINIQVPGAWKVVGRIYAKGKRRRPADKVASQWYNDFRTACMAINKNLLPDYSSSFVEDWLHRAFELGIIEEVDTKGGGGRDFNLPPLAKNPLTYNKGIDNKLSILGETDVSPEISLSQNKTIPRTRNRSREIENNELPAKNTPVTEPVQRTRTRKPRACALPPADDQSSRPTAQKPSGKKEPLLEYWNGLDHVRPHKNHNSQIYQSTARALRKLAAGTFFQQRGISLDPKWLKKRNLDERYTNKKFNNKQMRDMLDRLALMFHPRYEPMEKKWVRNKGLLGLIYCEYSGGSWWLDCVEKEPLAIKDAIEKFQSKNQSEDVTYCLNELVPAFEEAEMTFPDRGAVIKILKEMIKWRQQWHKEVLQEIGLGKLMKLWAEWMGDKSHANRGFQFHYFQPYNSLWNEFTEYLQEDVLGGIELLSAHRT